MPNELDAHFVIDQGGVFDTPHARDPAES